MHPQIVLAVDLLNAIAERVGLPTVTGRVSTIPTEWSASILSSDLDPDNEFTPIALAGASLEPQLDAELLQEYLENSDMREVVEELDKVAAYSYGEDLPDAWNESRYPDLEPSWVALNQLGEIGYSAKEALLKEKGEFAPEWSRNESLPSHLDVETYKRKVDIPALRALLAKRSKRTPKRRNPAIYRRNG